MNLTNLNINQKAILTKIDGDGATKRRLRSFGLDVRSQIEVKQKSIANANIVVLCKQGLVALRQNEAKMITCEVVA